MSRVYPMKWRQHEQLHDQLDHEAFHDRLEHRQFHRDFYQPYQSYYPYGGSYYIPYQVYGGSYYQPSYGYSGYGFGIQPVSRPFASAASCVLPQSLISLKEVFPPRFDGEVGAQCPCPIGQEHCNTPRRSRPYALVWLLFCCASVAVENCPPPLSRQRHCRAPFPFAGEPAYAVPLPRTQLG
jgi:hypothetical protein